MKRLIAGLLMVGSLATGAITLATPAGAADQTPAQTAATEHAQCYRFMNSPAGICTLYRADGTVETDDAVIVAFYNAVERANPGFAVLLGVPGYHTGFSVFLGTATDPSGDTGRALLSITPGVICFFEIFI